MNLSLAGPDLSPKHLEFAAVCAVHRIASSWSAQVFLKISSVLACLAAAVKAFVWS